MLEAVVVHGKNRDWQTIDFFYKAEEIVYQKRETADETVKYFICQFGTISPLYYTARNSAFV
jgi:hypothetical protein